MRIPSSPIVAVMALLTSAGMSARLGAQPAPDEFASNHFIVKVLEGVTPGVLPDGRLTFVYADDADQSPEALAGELLMADLLDGFGATAIEQLIYVELEGEALALAIQNGVMRQYVVHVPPGPDILLATELLSLVVTHLEYASPAWHAELLQVDDPLFGDQWSLHNIGQALNFPCEVACQQCENNFGQMGTPDSDIDTPEAWNLEMGGPIVVAVIDTGADMDHPDLAGKLVSGESFTEHNLTRVSTVGMRAICPTTRTIPVRSVRAMSVPPRTERPSLGSSAPPPTMPRASPASVRERWSCHCESSEEQQTR